MLAEPIQKLADGVRRRALIHTVRHNGGYLGQACSAAEILATLYGRVMRLAPSTAPHRAAPFAGVPGKSTHLPVGRDYNGPWTPDSDRFILSPAHYSLALYATLVEVGRLDEESLEAFNQDGSTVEMIGAEHSPGFEATTGSLSQGLSVGAGVAVARRMRGESGRVWVLISDGELQEGQTWEALQFAAHQGLSNLGVYLDLNGGQVDGAIADVLRIEPVTDKLRAFRWDVHDVDGHDVDALAAPAQERPEGRPLIVVARTEMSRGVPSLRTRGKRLHYVRFTENEAELAIRDLGLTMSEVNR